MDISVPSEVYTNGYKDWYIGVFYLSDFYYRVLDKPNREHGNYRACSGTKRSR